MTDQTSLFQLLAAVTEVTRRYWSLNPEPSEIQRPCDRARSPACGPRLRLADSRTGYESALTAAALDLHRRASRASAAFWAA